MSLEVSKDPPQRSKHMTKKEVMKKKFPKPADKNTKSG